jgi:hypothetical protein
MHSTMYAVPRSFLYTYDNAQEYRCDIVIILAIDPLSIDTFFVFLLPFLCKYAIFSRSKAE